MNKLQIPFGILCLLFMGCGEQLRLKKISGEFVDSNPPFTDCHASTIVENAPNRFMMAAFGGSHEGEKDVSIWLSETTKSGGWKAPEKMADGAINDTLRYPTWNPVLFKSNQGKLFLFYKVGPSPREWWGMLRTSEDNGTTWGTPKKLPDGVLGPIKNKPIQLANGTILSPSSTEVDTKNGPNWKAHIEKSMDSGKTWEIIPIDHSTEFNVIQPSILEYPDNKLQVLCRSRENHIMQAYSYDNGNTWGRFTKTDLQNPNSGTDAVTLRNGWHILVYNPKKKGDRVRANRAQLNVAISKDGKEWTDSIVLENEFQGEFSYPAIIQASDGKIHITYTYNLVNVKHVVISIES